MEETLASEVAEPKYKVVRVNSIVGKVVGGKLRNTRSFKKADDTDGAVANWKVKLDDGQTHDYVAVFDTDAAGFEAQVKAGEEITIVQKYKERITISEAGHEIREPLAQPELSYDAPMGDVDAMFAD